MKTRHTFHRFVDHVSFTGLTVAFILAVFICALAYWKLSSLPSGHGIGENISLWDAVYFSVVTISSLGYGDFQPKGISRLFATIEVLWGLVIIGLGVAKLASEGSSELRKLHGKVGGVWLDVVRFEDGKKIFGIIYINITEDGLSLAFGGENYNEDGSQIDSFESRLISVDWPSARFFYENSHGSENYTAGLVTLRFETSENGVNRFSGESIDFKRTVVDKMEGWKLLSENDIAALTKPESRKEGVARLIRTYFPHDVEPG